MQNIVNYLHPLRVNPKSQEIGTIVQAFGNQAYASQNKNVHSFVSACFECLGSKKRPMFWRLRVPETKRAIVFRTVNIFAIWFRVLRARKYFPGSWESSLCSSAE